MGHNPFLDGAAALFEVAGGQADQLRRGLLGSEPKPWRCQGETLERRDLAALLSRMTKPSPFRYFKTSPEIIRLAVMPCVRYPRSLRNLEDLLHERGIEISLETVRFWWNRFRLMFAAGIRRKRVERMRYLPNSGIWMRFY